MRDGTYDGITTRLTPPSNTTTTMQSVNCILKMAANRSTNTHLFYLGGVSYVTIQGGFLEGDLAHQNADNDAIRLYDANHITLTNIVGARWYEDGIYIGSNGHTSHDITITDCNFSYNHRNALVIVDAYNVTCTRFSGSYCDHSIVDVEPNWSYEALHDITFTDCEWSYGLGTVAGGGHGAFVEGHPSATTHGSIFFNNCNIHHNNQGYGMCGLWVQYLTNVQVLGGTYHHNRMGVVGQNNLRNSIFRNVVSYSNLGEGFYFDSNVVNTNLRWCSTYSNGTPIHQGTATYTDCNFL